MRIATVHQRASLIVGAGAVDIHEASGGRFGPGAADLYERWAGFADWAAAATLPDPEPYVPDSPGSPSPTPRQVFGIGLNYGAHAAESGFARPETAPPVLTKFPSCITGPYGEVDLPSDGHTDWEVDLVLTGTPQGVGLGRTPPRWLAPGDELTSYIEGIGEMRHRFVAGPHR